MVSKGLSICRSCSLAVLGLAPMAVGAMALAGLMAGTASASTIYSDNFSGSATANSLNGTAPTVDNGPSSTWTVGSTSGYTGFAANGSSDASPNGLIAYLQFTPVSGEIYTLSAGLDLVNPLTTTNSWMALGFMEGLNGNSRFDQPSSYGSPWALIYQPSPQSNGTTNVGTIWAGPGTVGGVNFTTTPGNDGTGVQDMSIVLNTMSSAWTYQVYDNGYALSTVNSGTFPDGNPTILGVGLDNTGVVGSFSNFSLTAVPEPASLGLFAVGGLGLLLLKRRKTA